MLKKVKSFLFENKGTRQTIAKNTFWLAVSNIGGRLLRAIIIVYAARVLGVNSWGVFSYAITLAAFLTVFIDFGVNHVLTREIAKAKDHLGFSQVLSTAFYLRILFSAGVVFIVTYLAPIFTNIEGAKALFPIIAFIIVFDTLREFGFSLIRGVEKMEQEAYIFLFTNLAIVAAGFITLRMSPNVLSFTWAYAIGTAVGMVTTFFALRKYVVKMFSALSLKLIKPILVSSWPFAISGLLGVLLTNTDVLIIGWLRSAEDVGLYSSALRMIQLLYVVPSIIALSALPTFARLARVDNEKMRRVFERIVSLAFLVAIPLAAGGVIVGKQLIGFVFGQSYMAAGMSFQVLMLTMLIDFPAVILSNAIFAYNNQRSLVVYSAIGGVSNVILDLILIPPFGIVGSAWATLIAQFISNNYLWRAMKKINYFEIMPHLKNIIGATAGMALISWLGTLVHMHVVVNIAISAIVYFGLLYRLKEPLLREVKVILKTNTASGPEPTL